MYSVIVNRPWEGWRRLGPKVFKTVDEAYQYGVEYADGFQFWVVLDMYVSEFVGQDVGPGDDYDEPTF